MARPSTPLISRRAAVDAALAIIDAEGLEAFSIRRLGRELGVNGASLYHHFADKDEILNEVVRTVLSAIRVPAEQATWQEWFVKAAHAYRAALLGHPNVAPLLLHRRPRMFGHDVIDFTAQQLQAGGVPKELQLAVLDASEMIAFASALFTRTEPEMTVARDPEQLAARAWDGRAPKDLAPWRELRVDGYLAVQAARQPRKEALRCGATSMTYAELNRAANLTATGLLASGLQPGDVEGVIAGNTPEVFGFLYGMARAGILRRVVRDELADREPHATH